MLFKLVSSNISSTGISKYMYANAVHFLIRNTVAHVAMVIVFLVRCSVANDLDTFK